MSTREETGIETRLSQENRIQTGKTIVCK